jgi:hypothetical protein
MLILIYGSWHIFSVCPDVAAVEVLELGRPHRVGEDPKERLLL